MYKKVTGMTIYQLIYIIQTVLYLKNKDFICQIAIMYTIKNKRATS